MSQDLWHDWHASGRPRTKLTPLLKAYQPYIGREVERWTGSGLPELVLRAEARRLAGAAFKSFDPAQAQLQTHLVNHLKGLGRFVTTYRDEVRLPAEKASLAGKVYRAKVDLEAELGREATQDEIAERSGVGTTTVGKLRRFQSSLYSTQEGLGQPEREDISHHQIAADFLYSQLSPMQKLVFGHSTGYGGAQILRPGEMALRLKVGPSRISGLKTEVAQKALRYRGAVHSLLESA